MKNLVEAIACEDSLKEKKKKSKGDEKKRNAVELVHEKDTSEASLEFGVPVNSRLKKKSNYSEMEADENENENPNSVCRFRISEPLKARLKEKGITVLFPIQAMTFDTVFDGFDLVGRARTGQEKTLAFVLPILESLVNGRANESSSQVTRYGRSPTVMVLLPTRELAQQVFEDFQFYGQALGLESFCFVRGMPYGPEEAKLRSGLDIIIGTPGRIKDHIENNKIDLRSLKFRVLDEADEMLRVGFVSEVEFILGKVEDANKVQTLLFSATLPHWVKDIASRFLKADKISTDLVGGNEKMKPCKDVRHIVIPCSDSEWSQLIPDIIRCYSSGGQTIIFTMTKLSASKLADILPGARAIHGDLQLSQRRSTLSKFKSGEFLVLVTTNVAARGLDIKNLQLIIQCEAPDIDAYIHRSGRTGRAGNTGVSVTLYDPRNTGRISRIERECGVKFELLAAPRPINIARSIGVTVAKSITQVLSLFKSVAEELVNNSCLSILELFTKIFAKLCNYTEKKSRSLLTSRENHVSLILKAGKIIYSPSFAYSVLRTFLPEEIVESVKGMTLTADGSGAVFDVKTEDLDAFLIGQGNAADVSIEQLKILPKLQDREQSRGGGRFGDGGFCGWRWRFWRLRKQWWVWPWSWRIFSWR